MAEKPPLPDVPALIVVGGPTDGEVFPLEKDRSIVVGSGRLANLRLGPSDISSAHFKVTWDDGGLFVNDNTSFTGTFLNGEGIEQAPLQDGDLLAFDDPKKQPSWPKIRVHVPVGSVIVLTPPPEPEPEPAKPKPAAVEAPAKAPERPRPSPRPSSPRVPVRGRPAPRGLTLPGLGVVEPKVAAALGGAALALLLLVVFLVRVFFGPKPTIEALQPAMGEPGLSVTVTGDRFHAEAAENLVRFGELPAKVTAAGPTSLTVVVPDGALPGEAKVTVQVGRRRSREAGFLVLKALRVSGLRPEVALPGEEVVATGSGLDSPSLILTVEGKPAQVVEAAADRLRFKVPGLAALPVRSAPVLVKTNEQVAKPAALLIGKLPLVTEVKPRRVEAGDKVTLEGRGFGPTPPENRVTVGPAPALVVTASPTALTVVAPDLGAAGLAPIRVEALGRSNEAPVPLQVGAGSSATYRLRFYAGTADGVGRASVSFAAGPVLLLASRDDAPSVEERAVRVAHALNALVDAASAGRGELVEARNPPALAAVGGAVLLRATADDAAACATTPDVLARHWAALVGDYLALFARGERPTRVFATSGRARSLLDVQSEVGFRPGVGVPAQRMAQLSPESRQKLRELALVLAPPSSQQEGAAVEGVWEGELQDSDGVRKAVSVELRLAGTRLSGTLTLGSKVAMKVPLQDLTLQGGTLRFTLRRAGSVHVFEGPVGAGEVSGPLREGGPTGPAVGRIALRYARPPG